MPPACPVAAAFVVVASGVSPWLIASRLTLPVGRAPRLLAALVLWEAIEILPVHVLASLQLMGVIWRSSISEVALLQFIIALVAGIWAVRKRRPEQGLIRKVAAQPIPRYVLQPQSCWHVLTLLSRQTSSPAFPWDRTRSFTTCHSRRAGYRKAPPPCHRRALGVSVCRATPRSE